jgi:Zn-dependent protease with chaperone function
MKAKIPLIGLTADLFRHPLDREATRQLKQSPGLDFIIRGLLGGVVEEVMYLNNIATSVQISDRQLPEIHQLLVEACRILDLEVPQLYLKQNPIPNAYTLAMRGEKPFIVVHTSLVDLLTPAELQAVLAHELGHLKCEHGVYITIANILVLMADGLIPGGFGREIARQMQQKILQWLRCAEFSCDRAALLVAQDPQPVISLLMKLTGGSPTLAAKLNVDAFLAQARAYETHRSDMGDAFKQLQVEQLTHPLPVLRAKEIDGWAQTKTYSDLLNGNALCYDAKTRSGEWRNW